MCVCNIVGGLILILSCINILCVVETRVKDCVFEGNIKYIYIYIIERE